MIGYYLSYCFVIYSKPNFSKDDIEESLEFEKDLDSLVEMLLYENHSGNYFLRWLQQQKNQVCRFFIL